MELTNLAREDLQILLSALAQPNVVATIHVTLRPLPQKAKTAAEHWTTRAREIARRIHAEQPGLTQDGLARRVRAEMVGRIEEPGMANRSGGAPSVGSIIRHSLGGLAPLKP